MRRFLALLRKETGGILFNPPILFATAFFVLLDSFAFYLVAVRAEAPSASFDGIANFILYTSLLLYPFVARHSFSADNANGTLELLLSAPISQLTVVLAKYASCMAFVLLHLVHAAVYAVLLDYGGNLDWNAALAALLALFAMGSAAMSLSVFISALTTSPAASTAGASGILVFMALAADLDPYSGTVPDILHSVSFVPHAKRWISGVLDTQGMIYFVTVTMLFLFYAWLAVSSQEPERHNRNATVRRRQTVTYLLVCGGFLLLLLQAALLNIGGYWEAGTTLGHNLARVPRLWLLPLPVAAGAFLWSAFTFRAARRAQRNKEAATNPKYATIRESQVLRAPRFYFEENIRTRQRAVLAALAALVVVVNLNWLSHYPFHTFSDGGRLSFLSRLQSKRWDVTRERKNTLAPNTIRALDNLQGRLQVYSFLPENLRVNNVLVASDLRKLLAHYTDNNALVSSVYADMDQEPELVRELGRELDLTPDELANNVIATYQGRRMTIPARSLAIAPDQRRRSAGDNRWVFDGENRLTQAILHLTDPRTPKIFFTYGHLEHSLSPGAVPERSVSRFVRALSAVNIQTRQHFFSSASSIPDDCEVLAVISPRLPFKKDEVREIADFLERGGRLLVFAPTAGVKFGAGDDPLNDFLFALGGSFRDDLVADPVHNDHGREEAVLGRPVTGNMEVSQVVFPLSRSIRDNPRSLDGKWHTRRMIQTYPTAGATGEITGDTQDGPFTLMYRSTRETPEGEARAAVFSSGAFVSNREIGSGMNASLAIATAQWLAGGEETSGIEARMWVDRRLQLTGPQIRALVWISVFAMPLVWLLAGISVWWLRRE